MKHIKCEVTLHVATVEQSDDIVAKLTGPNAGQSPSKLVADLVQRSDVSFSIDNVTVTD